MTTTPTAPGADLATDERALFEKWALTCDGNCNPNDLRKRPVSSNGDTYFNPLVERDWEVWQARADLAAVPASEPVHFVKSLIHPNGWHECAFADLEVHMRAGFTTRTLYTAPPVEGALSQPVQAVPDGWVDVEDRLPPPETDVFVRCLRGNSVGYDVAGIFHGKWMSFATEADTKGAVTHWAAIRGVVAAPSEPPQ